MTIDKLMKDTLLEYWHKVKETYERRIEEKSMYLGRDLHTKIDYRLVREEYLEVR
jgi:hypothetical protein